MGAKLCAQQLKIGVSQANTIISNFFKTFQKVKSWIAETKRYQMKYVLICIFL
jgi:DNA polymerase I-like protein with 3'-5' exonuclease and polymerase domains